MWNSVSRIALIAGVAISALALTQPALAATQLAKTGTVGAHKLNDRNTWPGATCLFDYSSKNHAYKLKHISADSPRMKAVPNMGIEPVGWNFTVQRRIISLNGTSPWGDRYTSKTFRSSTDSSHNADFAGHRGVKVTVPYGPQADGAADYRVIVKLFWYEADGTTVLGSLTERIDWYYSDQSKAVPNFHGSCPDWD